MSFINPFSWFSSANVAAVETNVINVIVKAKADLTVAETDITNAVGWLVAEAPALTSNINTLIALVVQVGANSNPQVAAAVAAANIAVEALNALATANKSGGSTAQAVVAGYTALKTAIAATATASAAVASAPAVKAS